MEAIEVTDDFIKSQNGNIPTGKYATFDWSKYESLKFGYGSTFGASSSFGDGSKFGDWSNFGDGSNFGDCTKFGDGSNFGDCTKFGDESKFGDELNFGENISILRINTNKIYCMSNIDGSSRQVKIVQSNSDKNIIRIEAGCFSGTHNEFLKKAEEENKIMYVRLIGAFCNELLKDVESTEHRAQSTYHI